MRMLSRVGAVLVLVVTGAVAALGGASPGSAAATSCSRSVTQPVGAHLSEFQTRGFGYSFAAGSFAEGATVTDLDVRVRVDVSGGAILDFRHAGASTQRLIGPSTGYGNLDVTFDDEAGGPWSPGATSGSWRPLGSFSAFDGSAAAGNGVLIVNNPGGTSGPHLRARVHRHRHHRPLRLRR